MGGGVPPSRAPRSPGGGAGGPGDRPATHGPVPWPTAAPLLTPIHHSLPRPPQYSTQPPLAPPPPPPSLISGWSTTTTGRGRSVCDGMRRNHCLKDTRLHSLYNQRLSKLHKVVATTEYMLASVCARVAMD